jgi:hypothetical protein
VLEKRGKVWHFKIEYEGQTIEERHESLAWVFRFVRSRVAKINKEKGIKD